jgi:predicted AlkP superfamily pyrophosphatase or phosphodiesterase
LTGLAPQEHGITGWFVYLKELGCVSAILPCRSRMGGHSFGELGADMTQIFNQTPIFNKLDVPCVAIIPDYIADSDYNRIHTGRAELVPYDLRLNHFFDSLRNNITGHEQRRFIYAYWPKLDSLAHLYGIGSDQVSEHFQQLDTFFGDLLNALAGTNSTVIVTSDHGFIDTDPTYRIELSQHPVLANTLILPLCGESRLAYCYVHVNQYQLFEEYINTRFAQSIELAHSRDLLKDGVFGLGRPHPALHNRIGHYVLMMKDRYTIKDWLINEKRYAHVGVHGGVSAEEMFVPLIIAEC